MQNVTVLEGKAQLTQLVAELDSALCALVPVKKAYASPGSRSYHTTVCGPVEKGVARVDTRILLSRYRPCGRCCFARYSLELQIASVLRMVTVLGQYIDAKQDNAMDLGLALTTFMRFPRDAASIPMETVPAITSFHAGVIEVFKSMTNNIVKDTPWPLTGPSALYVVPAKMWGRGAISKEPHAHGAKMKRLRFLLDATIASVKDMYLLSVPAESAFETVPADAILLPGPVTGSVELFLETVSTFTHDGIHPRVAVHTALAL